MREIKEIVIAAREMARDQLAAGYVIKDVHPYTNEKGEATHWVLRLKHPDSGEKWLRPIKRSGDGFVIGAPAYEHGKPLYNLANLAAAQPATVWLVEGEACADALNAFFARASASDTHIATTTGSATGVEHTALTPLHGRTIVIWPDHDHTGTKYARDLASELADRAASLREIDCYALALPHKGDCVDWLAAHPSATLTDIASLKTHTLAAAPKTKAETKREPSAAPASTAPAEQRTGRVVMRCLADVEMERLDWLWKPILARGKTTLIAGNPGLGKSMMAMQLAALVSSGGNFPLTGEPALAGNVIIASAEDAPGDTIKPRVHAASGTDRRIHLAESFLDTDEKGRPFRRGLSLRTDLTALAAEIEAIGNVSLVIIDPVTAYLDGIDSHKNTEVRTILLDLADLAQRHNCAVLAVSHLNKALGGDPLMRVMGSLAFVAGPRLVHGVLRDPANPQRRFLLPLKTTFGKEGEGFAYRVEGAELPGGFETSRIVWESSPVQARAEDVANATRDETASELEEARAFLRDVLKDGPMPSKEMMEAAEASGISERTLRRAQKSLNVTAKKTADGWKLHLSSEKETTLPGI